jgi:hypothetical protein
VPILLKAGLNRMFLYILLVGTVQPYSLRLGKEGGQLSGDSLVYRVSVARIHTTITSTIHAHLITQKTLQQSLN